MLVKAKILDVSMRDHKGKQVADISLLFSSPTLPVLTTMWNNSVEKGEHKPYAHLAGQEVELAIRVEEFNGKAQYNIYTGVLPQVISPVVKPAAVVSAKSA